MPDNSQIVDVLMAYTSGYAEGRGYVLGNRANNDLRRALAFQATSSVVDWAEDHQSLEKAYRGLQLFVDAMIGARPDVYNEVELRSRVIGERTFMAAKEKLCPLFPICS